MRFTRSTLPLLPSALVIGINQWVHMIGVPKIISVKADEILFVSEEIATLLSNLNKNNSYHKTLPLELIMDSCSERGGVRPHPSASLWAEGETHD